MTNRSRRVILFLALALPATGPAHAAGADCREARQAYRDALDSVARRLGDYTACLKSSHGDDDCAVAFIDLQSAQKDVEEAVAKIRDACS